MLRAVFSYYSLSTLQLLYFFFGQIYVREVNDVFLKKIWKLSINNVTLQKSIYRDGNKKIPDRNTDVQ